MRPSTRWLLGLVLVAIPALFFLPGIGFESSHPAALAKKSAPAEIWWYRVQPKDVLSRIAERELGTFTRYHEILALNPDIKPRKLVPGTVLRMPPRVPRAAGAAQPHAAPGAEATTGGDSRGLLLSFAGLLGALVLVVMAAGRMERRGDES